MAARRRVLSIQSHVVQGYVGNKCSVFTLQLLGFDVDPINSVQFSNHTGYATFRGTVLQGAELTSLIQGLEANNLLGGYTHMLTGYIGSPSFLNAVMGVYRRLKAANADILFICDPVLGDDGRLYVPAENVDIYRQQVLPLATMLTPNQFEAELLSGVTIQTEEDAIRACRVLHERGPETVVITSSRIAGLSTGADEIILFASTRRRHQPQAGPQAETQQGAGGGARAVSQAGGGDIGGGGGSSESQTRPAAAGGDAGAGGGARAGQGEVAHQEAGAEAAGGGVDIVDGDGAGTGAAALANGDAFDVYRVTFQRLPQQFTGTGDLAAALLLAWTDRLPENFAGALERVAGTIKAVLTRTHAEGSSELVLIQSKEEIERPPLDMRAVSLGTGH